MGIKLVKIKFIQRELSKMGLTMNNNKGEILVFGKTHTSCKTAEGIIVRALGRLLRNFASWSEVAVVLIHWHQISPNPPLKSLMLKADQKFGISSRPKFANFGGFGVWRSGESKVAIFTPSLQPTSFEPFCNLHQNRLRGLQVGWGKIRKSQRLQ